MLNDNNLDLCINYIEEGKCILFLGPQFAIDEKEQKVHQLVKDHLLQSAFKEKLDYSYDNMYVFRDPKPKTGDKMRLNIELKKVYQNISPHSLYDQLPFIPFSAIISCSPDHYLRDRFNRLNLPVQFQYFSRKGNANPTAYQEEVPLLYNLFGSIEDEDSLITTYTSFYKFIISVMGEEQVLPLELRNRIAEAKIFVLMGFDLTQWYIPLLAHKINSFRKEEVDRGEIHRTAMINMDNTIDDHCKRTFPIELMIVNGQTIPTVETIYTKIGDKGILRKPATDIGGDEIEQLKDLVTDCNFLPVFEKLRKLYQAMGWPDQEINMIHKRHTNNEKNLHSKLISMDAAEVEAAQITKVTLDLIQQLEKNRNEMLS